MERFHCPLLYLLLISFCVSCLDGQKKESKASQEQEEITIDDQGSFRALLEPLNSQFGDLVTGTMDVSLFGDDFEVQGQILSAAANTRHFQFISHGPRCPDIQDDKNKDGIIDLEEFFLSSGKVLIPLDSDLSEQLSGNDFGPIANTYGKYVYRKSTSLSLLLSDLLTDDPDRTDIYQKLPFGKLLNISKRIVVVLGLYENTVLPSSYKNPSSFSIQESVPIACGELIRRKKEEQIL